MQIANLLVSQETAEKLEARANRHTMLRARGTVDVN